VSWPIAWFGRPIANYVTGPLHDAGWTANGVTLLRTGVALAALILLATGNQVAWAVAATLFYAVFVLDCVDGDLSRLHDSATYWGKFVDGLSDFVFIGFAPLAAGIGLWIAGGDQLALLGGGAITCLALIHQMTRNRLSFFREWMVSQTGPLKNDEIVSAASAAAVQQRASALLIAGTFLAPILLYVPGGGGFYLGALLLVQALPDLVCVVAILLQANAILRRGRKSIHAAPAAEGSRAEP